MVNHVSQLQWSTAIFTHCTLRNRFRNAAIISKNIPSKRRTSLSEQTTLDQLSAHRPAVRSVLRPHPRQARKQLARQRISWPLQRWRIVSFNADSRGDRLHLSTIRQLGLAQALHGEWYTNHMPVFGV